MTDVYSIRSAELPLAGYKLVVRSPTLHQNEAILTAFSSLDFAPVWAEVQPVLEMGRKGETGGLVPALEDAVPKVLKALRDKVLTGGVKTLMEAAAICLDTRANHRRLAGKPVDDEFDPAPVKADDNETDPDGRYLKCDSLRAFVMAEMTVDEAIWVVERAVTLGGYADLGKALMSKAAGAAGFLGGLARPQTTQGATPITA